jgi:hypothetical protein
MPALLSQPPMPRAKSDPAALFDPECWIYDPVARVGIPRETIRPCSCGSTGFVLILRGDGTTTFPVHCAACYVEPRFRMARPDDLDYATLDVGTGRVTYTRDAAEINRHRRMAEARAKSGR